MKLQPVGDEIVNKLYKPGKIQAILDEFMRSDANAVKVLLGDGEYKNISSAQSSYHISIRRMGYPIIARTYKGDLYLVKLEPYKEVRA